MAALSNPIVKLTNDAIYSVAKKQSVYEHFKVNGYNAHLINDVVEVEEVFNSTAFVNFSGRFADDILIWPGCILPKFDNILEEFLKTLSYSAFIVRILLSNKHAYYIPENLIYEREMREIITIKYYGDIFNLNTLSGLVGAGESKIESRVFNVVDINGEWITKSSHNCQKIVDEYNFMAKMNNLGSIYYPSVRHLQVNDCSASYQIQYIRCPDAAILFINGLLRENMFDKFSKHIVQYFIEQNASSKFPDCSAISSLIDKLKSRVQTIFEQENYVVARNLINATTGIDLERNIIEFMKLFEYHATKNHFGKYGFIHGDLCLSNILYDYESDVINFIDPRGYSGSASAPLPIAYDIAKISHSLLGGYDKIIHGKIKLIIEDGKIDLEYEEILQEYENLTILLSDLIGVEFKYIRLIEASLFLSMIPLHIESAKKTLAFLLTFKHICERGEIRYE